MRAKLTPVLAVVTLVAACTVNHPLQEEGLSRVVAPSMLSVPRERLERMTLLTAYDALTLIPGFVRRVKESPTPHYTLWLDGTFTINIEILKLVRATDVREMRMLDENRSMANGGAINLVVTTFAGGVSR